MVRFEEVHSPGALSDMENGMKSTFRNERILGTRASLAGDASDIKSKFKGALARINQELWLERL
jgi:hypothetical protein